MNCFWSIFYLCYKLLFRISNTGQKLVNGVDVGVTGDSKHEFDAHMRLHFDHRCPFCDYSSRTEGRLRCHIKTFHADGGLCSAAPGPVADHAAKRKPKIITCQKCGFKAKEKVRIGKKISVM